MKSPWTLRSGNQRRDRVERLTLRELFGGNWGLMDGDYLTPHLVKSQEAYFSGASNRNKGANITGMRVCHTGERR